MSREHDAAEASSAASEMTLHRKGTLTSISSQRGSLTRRAHRLFIERDTVDARPPLFRA